MSQIVCLGFCIIPFTPQQVSPFLRAVENNPGYLHRGHQYTHIVNKQHGRIGDLTREQSLYIGPLLGPVGILSQELGVDHCTKQISGVYINAYIILLPQGGTQLRASIFCNFSKTNSVLEAFHNAGLSIEDIPNYRQEVFFNTPQLQRNSNEISSLSEINTSQLSVEGCKSKLLIHQIKAVKFIKGNESEELAARMKDLWCSPSTTWIRHAYNKVVGEDEEEEFGYGAKGTILADDMGLGKTLTSLALIQQSKNLAIEYGRHNNFLHYSCPRSSSTLIICPLSTLSNWENEILIHFESRALPYLIYHGDRRNQIRKEDLLRVAIVLTTYETVAPTSPAEGSNRPMQQPVSYLHQISWYRIILDEAHYIKDPKASRSTSINGLRSQWRLCLTGTPLQNRLGDLQSLLIFLRVRPWSSDIIWKGVEKTVKQGIKEGVYTLNKLMEIVSIRRVKTTILTLPKKVEQGVTVRLGERWEKEYIDLHTMFVMSFGKNRMEGIGWDSGQFFRMLSELRQLCNHPALTEDVPVQYSWRDGAKIVHLVQHLKTFLSGQGRRVSNPKAVVFSEYSRFLEIIKIALEENAIGYTELVGRLDVKQRDDNLKRFRGSDNCKVLLSTIRCGGVGIDLRCAQNVYIMEPSWNPAVEEQAVDRLYRMGQQHEVHVLRYFVGGSIEVNMLQLKKRKQELSMLSVPNSGNEEYEMAKMLMGTL